MVRQFKLLLVFAGLISFIAMGCNLTKAQKGTMIGAGAGAGVGAGIGKATGNTALGAAIGGVAGGIIGGIIGKKMDKQAAQIEKEVPNAKVEVVPNEDSSGTAGIKVEFNSKILFGFDQYDLSAQAKQNLNDLVRILNIYPDTDIDIQGYTDNTGTAAYNMQLSQRRADAVANYVKANGIDASRVTTTAFGLTNPAYPNDTEANRALNRRVEFVITPNEKMIQDAKDEAERTNNQ